MLLLLLPLYGISYRLLVVESGGGGIGGGGYNLNTLVYPIALFGYSLVYVAGLAVCLFLKKRRKADARATVLGLWAGVAVLLASFVYAFAALSGQ